MKRRATEKEQQLEKKSAAKLSRKPNQSREEKLNGSRPSVFKLQRTIGNQAFGQLAEGPALQRKCDCGGTCSKCKEEELRRKDAGGAGPSGSEAPDIVHEVLRSSGQPLDPATRSFMESRFGEDLSRVRVHTDKKAAESARAVNALAYTVGQDIVFGAGQFAPETATGKNLLAHELAHTIQQSSPGEHSSPLRISSPGDPLEGEAGRAAETVSGGGSYATAMSGSAVLARQGPAPAAGVTPPSPPPPTQEPQLSEDDLAEAGFIALARMLQKAGEATGVFRELYNQGKAAIDAKIADMRAKGLPENEIAEQASNMRRELANEVREASGALQKKAAELFDLVRGNVERPGYQSLKALGKTDAAIIRSATKTNKFINALPSGLKWTGRAMWVAAAALSIYLVIEAPPEKKAEVAAHEAGTLAGGAIGGMLGEAACIGLGIVTEGIGLLICGLLGGAVGVAAGGAAPEGMAKVAETQIKMLQGCDKLTSWWEKAFCRIGASYSSKPTF